MQHATHMPATTDEACQRTHTVCVHRRTRRKIDEVCVCRCLYTCMWLCMYMRMCMYMHICVDICICTCKGSLKKQASITPWHDLKVCLLPITAPIVRPKLWSMSQRHVGTAIPCSGKVCPGCQEGVGEAKVWETAETTAKGIEGWEWRRAE